MTTTTRSRFSRPVAWNRSLSRRSSSSRPTNGASSASLRLRPPRSPTTRSARHAGTGDCLPLSGCSPAGSKAIAARGGALRRFADEDASRRRRGLEPCCGVDEVAGDHALVRRADGHGRLAGQDPGACLDACAERRHGVDEVEGGADGQLGIVLVSGRRAPDGHDRIADELLDGAAVAADHVAGKVEVAGQRVADVLRVALLGEWREADQIREQDCYQLALTGGRWCGRGGRRVRAA